MMMEKPKKPFKILYKEITKCAPDDIELNRICRVWNNV